MTVHYRVSISDPDAHLIDVRLDVESPDQAGQRLDLPDWIPGSYMIREFSKNIVAIEATCDGRAVELEKLGKSSWQAAPCEGTLHVSMQVHAWDRSVRTAHVDRSHAFFNGTSLFLKVAGRESAEARVTIERPSFEAARSWRVATAMTAEDIDADGFGTRVAEDYDELIDHPVEMGDFQLMSFEAHGVPHDVVISGQVEFSKERLLADLKRICEWEIDFFGRPAPVDHYLFMTAIVGRGYGGLEHRRSTALMAEPWNLPAPNSPLDAPRDDNYIQYLGLCSHEYFHTWNVKRIKPARFIPMDLDREIHTELLWFFEGMTSYYDDIALVRSGLIDESQYLDLVAKTLTRVERGPGRLRQSAAESSFDAWTKFYKKDSNSPNAIVSYYAQGALIALCLDARLRAATGGEKSLDDLMRTLWQRWLESGGDGVEEREPQALASELAGEDLGDFFARHLHGTEPLPLEASLEELGVSLVWEPRRDESDRGSVEMPTDADTDGEHSRGGESASGGMACWLGAVTSQGSGGLLIQQVINGSPAERAGLAPGDTLVAIGGLSVSAGNIQTLLDRLRYTPSVELHYFRDAVLRTGDLPLESPPADTARLAISNREKLSRWLDQ